MKTRLRTKRVASGAAPLSAHLVLSTEKLSEGQELTSRIWSRHMSEVPGKRRYSADISRFPLGRSWICYVDCRSAMRVEAEGNKDQGVRLCAGPRIDEDLGAGGEVSRARRRRGPRRRRDPARV